MSSSKLKTEIKGLGVDIASAFKQAKNSPEFRRLQKDLLAGIKSVSSSLGVAMKAAKKSPQTKKLQRRLGRVAKLGTKEGAIKAAQAEKVAVAKLKQARKAIQNLSHRKSE